MPGYIGWRLLPALAGPFGGWGVACGVAFLLAACILILLGVNARALAAPAGRDRKWIDGLAWIGLITMGFFSSLFIMTILRDLLLGTAHLLLPLDRAAALYIPSAWWTLGLTLTFTVVGLVVARHPRLVEIELPIQNLPAPLRGFSIAQISDLHVGPTIKRPFVERIVRRVNRLNADLIAITGDLVDGSVRDLSPHTAALANLVARHGIYVVTGNHEYYSGERAWTLELRRLGLTVLKNEHVVLDHDGAALLVAGVTDYSAHHYDPTQRSDPAAALHGAPSGTAPKILLAHQPSSAPAAAAAGYDVQLSGHTHGGQFWPWNLFVGYFQPFTSGLNRLRQLLIYVSRGTGYWGPPNRFFVPAEITRLKLVPA